MDIKGTLKTDNMEKLFLLFEKLGAWGNRYKEEELFRLLNDSLIRLDRDIKMNAIDSDQIDEDNVKLSIVDVMFYLMLEAAKRNMCLDCLADLLENKLKYQMDHCGESVLVMQPKIVIKNNTGPQEFNSEQSQIIPKI